MWEWLEIQSRRLGRNLDIVAVCLLVGAVVGVVVTNDWARRLEVAEAELDTLRRLELAVDTMVDKPVITHVVVYPDTCQGEATIRDGQVADPVAGDWRPLTPAGIPVGSRAK